MGGRREQLLTMGKRVEVLTMVKVSGSGWAFWKEGLH